MLVNDKVQVELVIPAPPEAIFALLADPAKHAEIDGSGTVTGTKSRQLKLGDVFGMSMNWGVKYRTKNVVIEFEPNRLIAWQTWANPLASKFITGRIWRYQLEPVAGGTKVTETWDISQERFFSKPAIKRIASMTEKNMQATLAKIAKLVTTQ